MRQHNVKLPSGMTKSRGSNSVKKSLCVSSLLHLSLSPSFSSAFLCFRFTFRQALCTCWQRWPAATPSFFCLCNCHSRGKGHHLSQLSPMKVPGMSLIGLSGTTGLSRNQSQWPGGWNTQIGQAHPWRQQPTLNPVEITGGGSASPKENRDAVFLSRGNQCCTGKIKNPHCRKLPGESEL